MIDYDQPVGLQSQRESGIGTYVSINVNINVLCAQNFGGSDCTECVPGFTGPNCESDVNIDNCVGVDCSRNGQCVDDVDSFSCTCDPDFTGDRCQTTINDCLGVDCSGNRRCVDGVNSYTCECMTGYSGPRCDEGIFKLK